MTPLSIGCVRLGNFPIEREIRKRISPPTNPSSGWISIKKSKSGFFGFPFLSFDWEIRKRICKTVLLNSGLLFTNYACACKTAVPKDSFSILFRISQSNGKKENPTTPDLDFLIEIHPEDGFLGGEIRFGFRVRLGNPDLDFEKLNPDFPIERTLNLQ